MISIAASSSSPVRALVTTWRTCLEGGEFAGRLLDLAVDEVAGEDGLPQRIDEPVLAAGLAWPAPSRTGARRTRCVAGAGRARCSSPAATCGACSATTPASASGPPTAVEAGLTIPLVSNTSAYDALDSLALLDGVVDVYLPDLKLLDPGLTRCYLGVPDYGEVVERQLAVGQPAGVVDGVQQRADARVQGAPGVDGPDPQLVGGRVGELPDTTTVPLLTAMTSPPFTERESEGSSRVQARSRRCQPGPTARWDLVP